MRKILLYFALKYNGNYVEILKAIKEREYVDNNDLDNIESQIKSKYITILDPLYPECLKQVPTPPLVLFYYGNINLLNNPNKIAVIGKRKCSNYGIDNTIKIIDGLKKYQATIVSGLAIGIDSTAHKHALKNELATISVLGCGIDYCYPKANQELYELIKKKGLIISEYPNNLIPEPKNFLIRNRIIAAISNQIVVIEANYKSGTMNTVSYALEYNKEVCCLPYLANKNSGCNMLIKQGAKLIETADDIYE